MSAQPSDLLYSERSGIPGVLTAQEIADLADAGSVAAGSTLGLEQSLLASTGQVGKTVLAVPYVHFDGAVTGVNCKAQITSLEAGNVMFVYASGADFNAGIIQEGPVFLGDGEVYVIENVQAGSIITFSEGGYGFCQQKRGAAESPMPLMSFALSFKDAFMFAFRSSQTYAPGTVSANQGWVHIVNGPLSSVLDFRNDAGSIVQGQGGIELAPWEYLRLYTDANGEYRITSTNPVMAAHNANMSITVPAFYDSRLVLPVTNKGISWPRSGFISALYPGTVIKNYVNDLTNTGASPSLTVNPGTPLDWDAVSTTGASDQDYEPRGATLLEAVGLVTAYSGADSSGVEASPLCPVSTFTQRLALPLHIRNSGDGGGNGIALSSIYTGVARVYEWNQTTGQKELVTFNGPDGLPTTEIRLIRRDGANEFTATLPIHQKHPSSALVSAQGAGGSDAGAHDMLGDYNGGYVEVDVPSTCVFNAEQNENGQVDHTFRGTSGTAVVGIASDDDEQLTYGITPEYIRAEVTQGVDGMRYKRVIDTGVETWETA